MVKEKTFSGVYTVLFLKVDALVGSMIRSLRLGFVWSNHVTAILSSTEQRTKFSLNTGSGVENSSQVGIGWSRSTQILVAGAESSVTTKLWERHRIASALILVRRQTSAELCRVSRFP